MSHEESKIQREIVKTARMVYPKSVLFAIPNGGKRSAVTAAILKGEGVLAGVSDLIFIHEKKIYFLEVKTEEGRQSDSQKEFQALVEKQGFPYVIIRNTTDFLSYFNYKTAA